jgi:hypothetical protein
MIEAILHILFWGGLITLAQFYGGRLIASIIIKKTKG